MIFEKIAQAQSFEEVQKILIDTHVFMGGRDRSDTKELSPTIGLVVSEILSRSTFEQDFEVLLKKLQHYVQSTNRFQRRDLAEHIFNTIAVFAPNKYCFVVNSWRTASAQDSTVELEQSINHLVEKGYDIATLICWIDELSLSRPKLWEEITSSIFRKDPNVYYPRHVQLLVTANKINEEEIVGVFNKMSQALNGTLSLGSESAPLIRELVLRYNITLESFIDQMYQFNRSSQTPTTEFLILLQDFIDNPTTSVPSYPHAQTAVLESLISVFGLEYSPKYTPALLQFEKCYNQYHKSNQRVKEWFAKMPYEEAVGPSRAQKSDTIKKKVM